MTVNGLDERKNDPDLADPTRPLFAINGVQVEIARLPGGQGREPARLRHRLREHLGVRAAQAGRSRGRSAGRVTAVQAGDFKIAWRVAAGLDGKAKAVAAGGGPAPRGSFSGTISDEAPDVRVADDGKTIVNGTR